VLQWHQELFSPCFLENWNLPVSLRRLRWHFLIKTIASISPECRKWFSDGTLARRHYRYCQNCSKARCELERDKEKKKTGKELTYNNAKATRGSASFNRCSWRSISTGFNSLATRNHEKKGESKWKEFKKKSVPTYEWCFCETGTKDGVFNIKQWINNVINFIFRIPKQ
jgi:hypothetical protein